MTLVKDLKKEIQEILLSKGFIPQDHVTPTTVQPTIGDLANDGQISFYIKGRSKSGSLLVGQDSQIHFFNNRSTIIQWSVYVPGIARWAQRIDPPSGPDSWDPSIRRAERVASQRARSGLVEATGVPPTGPFEASASHELTQLPIGHPAKGFVEGFMRKFGEEITAAGKAPTLKERNRLGSDVYNKYYPLLESFKSIKASYDAGTAIWRDPQFQHLHDKSRIQILYPGAGSQVGALALAMSLIDEGAPSVSAIFTEIDPKSMGVGFDVLREWIESSPFLDDFIVQPKSSGLSLEGYRVSASFLYKGKEISLTYAMGDSPPDLFFHPDDLRESDVVFVHDPYSEVGGTDALLLGQILPELSQNPDLPGKAVVISNELDNAVPLNRSMHAGSLRSVLPILGRRVAGSFGHAGMYPVRYRGIGDYWSMGEVGQAHLRSAVIFSTGHPLLQGLRSDEAWRLVDLAHWAGGESVSPADPGVPQRNILSGMQRSAYKRIKERDPVKIFEWVAKRMREANLSGDNRDYLSLVVARMIAITNLQLQTGLTFGKKITLSQVPEPLRKTIAQAMNRTRLRRKDEATTLSQLLNPSLAKIQTIDRVLLRLQQKSEQGNY